MLLNVKVEDLALPALATGPTPAFLLHDSLSRKEVPCAPPKGSVMQSTSHRMLWPLLDVRSNVTMGTKAPLLSWSMLKTEKT